MAFIDLQKNVARRRDLLDLLKRQQAGSLPFAWRGEGVMPMTIDDLELLLPRAEFPQNEERRKGLLTLIDLIERKNPGFLEDHLCGLHGDDSAKITLYLHLANAPENLTQTAASTIRDLPEFLQQVNEIRVVNEMLADGDNRPPPVDDNLYSWLEKDFSSAFIWRTIYDLRKEKGRITEADMAPLLNLAIKYPVDHLTLEQINRCIPLPSSLYEVHSLGMANLVSTLMIDRPDIARFLSRQRERFSALSDDQKMDTGEEILKLLAGCYRIAPPPSLSSPYLGSKMAEHIFWDPSEKDRCFSHPLGEIRLNKEKPAHSFEDFVLPLAHEFIHGLEDVSLLLLNQEFRVWLRENGGQAGVTIGNGFIRDRLQAAGLALSFNSACGEHPAFAGTAAAAYAQGCYYSPDGAQGESTSSERTSFDRYENQLRERHAFLFEAIILATLRDCLNQVEKTRPLRPPSPFEPAAP